MYVCMYVCMYVGLYIYVCMYVCMYVFCMYVCMCMRVNVWYICACVCIYVYVHRQKHPHTHTHLPAFSYHGATSRSAIDDSDGKGWGRVLTVGQYNRGAGCSSVDSVPAFEAVGRRIDPSQWTQLQFGLFSVPTSGPQLVYQRPWYVLFCLWKSAYKTIPCCLSKRVAYVAAAGFLLKSVST